ncbi:pyridoxamine phosphate oxidase [Colletotrichum graminicola]|uniref:Pyridoxamine phosphate oxidase n=1 Tax=Colletotrichum graminicola (strain M1.001 / M2 / FGSC 10212) TaxID=645133 RepID=E3QWG1_COLGM|nr:pyridoxamine phosphate oxidase [Colletotrichum graminicola M1.001]EFQ35199.1 pyridoxamine phosphate oxidase [Colletotrichum graminicola M1.001]WDK10000.1 pyridoxamine phosphate oxidase [Colletotrichum graminicola]
MKLYPSISTDLADWATRQPVFFTASAPTHLPHINVSPKGLSAHFAVLSPNLVAYIDRTGSGCETIAHSYENGRLTLMFMSFGPSPRILRLFCKSRIIEWDHPEFDSWMKRIVPQGPTGRDSYDGARAVVVGEVWEAQTSCGYGVPMVRKELYAPPAGDGSRKGDELSVFEERPTLDFFSKKSVDNNTINKYRVENNRASLDGLPGLRVARRDAGETLWVVDARARLARAARETDGLLLGVLLAVLAYCAVTWGAAGWARATAPGSPI